MKLALPAAGRAQYEPPGARWDNESARNAAAAAAATDAAPPILGRPILLGQANMPAGRLLARG